MKVSDFTFDLPEELIAQDPLEDRSSSRLLTLDKNTGEIGHDVFHNIVNYLKPGDCLVLNNTKVIPARLIGAKEETGGKVEVLLLKRKQDNVWETLVKPGKKARPGARISFGDGKLVGEVIDVVDEGNRLVKFEYEGIFEEILDQLGQMPLPPYITHQLKDKNRYQTVYAKYDGSAAAPTAGLHFTPELLEEGFVREIISKIQTMRKEAGFEVMDKIQVYVKDNKVIEDIMKAHAEEIQAEVLAEKLLTDTAQGYVKSWNINSQEVTLGVEKVNQ